MFVFGFGKSQLAHGIPGKWLIESPDYGKVGEFFRGSLAPDWTGKLHITQTYDDGYASEDYNGPNHREVGAHLLWDVLPALELHAGWQHSWAGEDVRRDGGDDLSWGQIGLISYF